MGVKNVCRVKLPAHKTGFTGHLPVNPSTPHLIITLRSGQVAGFAKS